MRDPDALAIGKILAIEPRLHGVERASRALGLDRHELLHAGPSIADPHRICRPILHSAITAVLFERWSDSPEEAERLIRRGAVRLRPAQELRCVVPLADVVSPSMWLHAVGDDAIRCWSPLNGGMHHVLRVGVLGADVLEHLRWINGPFAEVFADALSAPVPILDVADEGIAGGDDCHGRTAVATSALLRMLGPRLAGPQADRCRAFLRESPSFFLNLWMAASKAMLEGARGIDGCTVVTAAGGNGVEFGIQIASKPDRWFVCAAAAPAVAPGSLAADVEPLGAIGDSAVVDILGLGAMMTMQQRNANVSPLPSFVEDNAAPTLLAKPHPRFRRTHPWMVLSAQRIVESRRTPIVSLGVLDKFGRLGRVAGGYYRPPLDIFERAVASVQP